MINNETSSLNYLTQWLESYLNFEKCPKKNIFWLNTMQYLCNRFNNPQNSYNSIHIAGSKGKGSVSSYIANILEQAGYNTGLYTSPHILNFSERIGKAQNTFSEEIYERTVKEMIPLVDSIIPDNLPNQREATWFELVTLFAFLVFKNNNCQWGVFETGMGGRLDATNVILPKVSVISTIELEHTEFLGDTLEKIAFEKAGIIKPNIPVISTKQKDAVSPVLRKVAEQNNSEIYFIDELLKNSTYKIENNKSKIHLEFTKFFNRPIETTLNFLGEFQLYNAAIAALACKIAIPEIDEHTIELGLSKAFLPGRFEIIPRNDKKQIPQLVMDGAHTVDSITLTLKTFRQLFPSSNHLLFACAYDKNMTEMSKLFFKNKFSKIIITKPGLEKESNLPFLHKTIIELNEMQKEKANISSFENPEIAIKTAFQNAYLDNDVLLICGSFYLVAEVKKVLKKFLSD